MRDQAVVRLGATYRAAAEHCLVTLEGSHPSASPLLQGNENTQLGNNLVAIGDTFVALTDQETPETSREARIYPCNWKDIDTFFAQWDFDVKDPVQDPVLHTQPQPDMRISGYVSAYGCEALGYSAASKVLQHLLHEIPKNQIYSHEKIRTDDHTDIWWKQRYVKNIPMFRLFPDDGKDTKYRASLLETLWSAGETLVQNVVGANASIEQFAQNLYVTPAFGGVIEVTATEHGYRLEIPQLQRVTGFFSSTFREYAEAKMTKVAELLPKDKTNNRAKIAGILDSMRREGNPSPAYMEPLRTYMMNRYHIPEGQQSLVEKIILYYVGIAESMSTHYHVDTELGVGRLNPLAQLLHYESALISYGKLAGFFAHGITAGWGHGWLPMLQHVGYALSWINPTTLPTAAASALLSVLVVDEFLEHAKHSEHTDAHARLSRMAYPLQREVNFEQLKQILNSVTTCRVERRVTDPVRSGVLGSAVADGICLVKRGVPTEKLDVSSQNERKSRTVRINDSHVKVGRAAVRVVWKNTVDKSSNPECESKFNCFPFEESVVFENGEFKVDGQVWAQYDWVYWEDDQQDPSTQLDRAIEGFLATVSNIRGVSREDSSHTWKAMELELKERIRIATFLRHCSASADIACALRQYAPVRHVRKEDGTIVREFCVADDSNDVAVPRGAPRQTGNPLLNFFKTLDPKQL